MGTLQCVSNESRHQPGIDPSNEIQKKPDGFLIITEHFS